MTENSIELGDFELYAQSSNSSLVVSSYLFASPSDSSLSHRRFESLVQNGQLWFLPQRICQIQIVIKFDGHNVGDLQHSLKLLQFLGETIRMSILWEKLGLSIQLIKIKHYTENDQIPNLYFEVEHPDMSSALLSPPEMNTGSINGMVFVFNYHTTKEVAKSSRSESRSKYFRNSSFSRGVVSRSPQKEKSQGSFSTTPTNDNVAVYDPAHFESDLENHYHRDWADLAKCALNRVVGLKTIFPGIKMRSPVPTSTLLELGPVVWNARYAYIMAAYSENFPVLSEVITLAQSWRPSLQQKVEHLVHDRIDDESILDEPMISSNQNSVQRRLWKLLSSTIDIDAGTRHCSINHEDRRANLKELEKYLWTDEDEDDEDVEMADQDLNESPFDSLQDDPLDEYLRDGDSYQQREFEDEFRENVSEFDISPSQGHYQDPNNLNMRDDLAGRNLFCSNGHDDFSESWNHSQMEKFGRDDRGEARRPDTTFPPRGPDEPEDYDMTTDHLGREPCYPEYHSTTNSNGHLPGAHYSGPWQGANNVDDAENIELDYGASQYHSPPASQETVHPSLKSVGTGASPYFSNHRYP